MTKSPGQGRGFLYVCELTLNEREHALTLEG